MTFEEFNREYGDIILFPGSLEELNSTESVRGIDTYKIMRLDSGIEYVQGLLLPRPSEAEERDMGMKRNFTIPSTGIYGVNAKRPTEKTHKKNTEIMVEAIEKLYTNPIITELDIRARAKSLGAAGVIRFQRMHDNIYMGVPIKLLRPVSPVEEESF